MNKHMWNVFPYFNLEYVCLGPDELSGDVSLEQEMFASLWFVDVAAPDTNLN